MQPCMHCSLCIFKNQSKKEQMLQPSAITDGSFVPDNLSQHSKLSDSLGTQLLGSLIHRCHLPRTPVSVPSPPNHRRFPVGQIYTGKWWPQRKTNPVGCSPLLSASLIPFCSRVRFDWRRSDICCDRAFVQHLCLVICSAFLNHPTLICIVFKTWEVLIISGSFT